MLSLKLLCLAATSLLAAAAEIPEPAFGWLPAINTYQNETQCTYQSAVVRKEWSSMTKDQRRAFVEGVKCMLSKPSVVPDVPAAQSFYADFAFLHINYARDAHFNGRFFHWHRHHVWLFEQGLHECGFPKNLGVPYMHWPLYAEHGFENSTIFDESDSSLGGNGWPDNRLDGNSLRIPHGSGGGCIMRGPFHDLVNNFQPFYDRYALTGLPSNWTEPITRCIDRDFNKWALQNNLNQDIYDSCLAQPDFASFQNGSDDPHSSFALHVAGHAAVGMTMNDLFGGTFDPSFWLHHSGVDRLWTSWQNIDRPNRENEFNGTDYIMNLGGNLVNMSTPLFFSTIGAPMQMNDVKDPMSGPYCYRFEEPTCLDGRGCYWLEDQARASQLMQVAVTGEGQEGVESLDDVPATHIINPAEGFEQTIKRRTGGSTLAKRSVDHVDIA